MCRYRHDSSNLHERPVIEKQIIQLIDYSDVSSGPDSIQAADESGTTTGNNWLAK